MTSKLIIQGALYFNGKDILRPLHSGELFSVACLEYKTRENVLTEYEDAPILIEEILGSDKLIYKGIEYFEALTGLHYVSDMQLISDPTKIIYFDKQRIIN